MSGRVRLNEEEITKRFIRLGEEHSDPSYRAERALWHAAAGDMGLLEIDYPEVVARFPTPTSKVAIGQKRKRRPSLASVARQVTKAGIEVARYEIDADGKVAVVPGKPEIAPNDRNEWDTVQ
jgi:hypothetical protein